MPEFKTPSIGNAIYLLDFAEIVPKIRLEQGRAERAYEGFVFGQSQQTNVPDDADPNMARIILDGNHKRILISQVKSQLDFDFEKSELTLGQQIDVVEKNARDFHRRTTDGFAVIDYRVHALIVDLQYPSANDQQALQSFIYDRFFKSPPVLPVASALCQLGFRSGHYFVNITANAYESRRFEIAIGGLAPNPLVARQLKDMELVETGLAFRIDVNNRPRVLEPGYKLRSDPEGIFDTLRSFLTTEFIALTGLRAI